jgi:hypothetical protein
MRQPARASACTTYRPRNPEPPKTVTTVELPNVTAMFDLKSVAALAKSESR